MAASSSLRNDVCDLLSSRTLSRDLIDDTVTYGSEDSTKAAAADATSPYADLSPSAPLPLIIRATNGKSKDKRANKVKISTLVQPDALDVFFARYAEVCKAGMSGLKKRDRSKAKEKLKAKKKKLGAAAPAEVKK